MGKTTSGDVTNCEIVMVIASCARRSLTMSFRAESVRSSDECTSSGSDVQEVIFVLRNVRCHV